MQYCTNLIRFTIVFVLIKYVGFASLFPQVILTNDLQPLSARQPKMGERGRGRA